MIKASYDNQDWARLVEEIQLAKAAYETASQEAATPVQVSVANEQIVAQDAQRQEPAPHSTLVRHELNDDLKELLGAGALVAENEIPAGRSGIRSHLAWGIGGFVLGAICWHLVGFWDFVGDVVLSGSQNTTVVERSIEPASKPRVLSYVKNRAPNSIVETTQNCSAFYRDAETGLARPTKCQTAVRALGSGRDASNR